MTALADENYLESLRPRFGSFLGDLTLVGATRQDGTVMRDLLNLVRGGLRPAVAAVMDLRDLPAAQAAFAAKRHVGKIVLTGA